MRTTRMNDEIGTCERCEREDVVVGYVRVVIKGTVTDKCVCEECEEMLVKEYGTALRKG